MKKLSNLEKSFIFLALLFLIFSTAAVTAFSWLSGKIADAAVSKDIEKIIIFCCNTGEGRSARALFLFFRQV